METILSNLPKERLHLSCPVRSAQSLPSGQILLSVANGSEDTFDHVIFACHSDTALQILQAGDITADEARILQKFTWNKNEAVLHADTEVSRFHRLDWLADKGMKAYAKKKTRVVQLELSHFFRRR